MKRIATLTAVFAAAVAFGAPVTSQASLPSWSKCHSKVTAGGAKMAHCTFVWGNKVHTHSDVTD